MKITFESGEGSLEVEPDSKSAADHSAFLADLLLPGGMQVPGQRAPAEVKAAPDLTPERVEFLLTNVGGLAIVGENKPAA